MMHRTTIAAALVVATPGCLPDEPVPQVHEPASPSDLRGRLPPAPPRPMNRLVHSHGQTVYVPAYSGIPQSESGPEMQLSVVLSIHNTDGTAPLTIQRVDYYDTSGQQLEPVLSEPLSLPPMATKNYLVKRLDKRGGAGANFIVSWSAEEEVTEPIVETVNFYLSGPQAYAFVGGSRVIESAVRDDK